MHYIHPHNRLSALLALACGMGACLSLRVGVRVAHPHPRTSLALGMSAVAPRVPFMAGNWKMNTVLGTAVDLAQRIAVSVADAKDVDVALIPPYPFLRDVGQQIVGTNIKLGAQNCYFEAQGAFTGAVSAGMLSSVGCQYVLCGHSERRNLFNDDDATINHRVERVLEAGMTPILCIGETRTEYELGLSEQICTLQLSKDLRGLSEDQIKKIIIAYEPVWAIGTGLTATPDIAQGVHAAIRKYMTSHFGAGVAQVVRILYGGSVTPDTVDSLMACEDVDGCLVGGASLAVDKFSRIVNYTRL